MSDVTRMRVCAVQLDFSYAATPQEYTDRIRGPLERAAGEGARLAVLPNYTGLMLLGTAVPQAADDMSLAAIARAGGYNSVTSMLTAASPMLREFYLHIYSSLAARLQLYLVPGTVVEMTGGRLCNAAYLFNPEGRVIGSQQQCHRSSEEIQWGLTQGKALRVMDVGEARIGLVIGEDIRYPEVSRILALQGANVLIHPAAYSTWHSEHFLLDLWREVQSNQVFGLQACAVGAFRGQSAVYAPVEMTPGGTGMLAMAKSTDGEESITADLDLEALQRTIDTYPIFEGFNYDLYARELPRVYPTGSTRGDG